ncbi:nuclear transport factor 2 family protein [Streptomyces sp. NPDC002812]|uniref:nuclear transport factor 2 family protein n=1 Tax=Streptomyces TaxID=1883 RepID=UPI00225C3ABF|nr:MULTISPECIES: nuclear transport factor 2 family protein [unclassified Streptomyces]MCX5127780.1 nuclear transport factor 2 family protein [Streptomyces sp. NBC_00347]MCX5301555.1 nuclear transport factor 2 family protein [Streptomyces sp. NBC_00193]
MSSATSTADRFRAAVAGHDLAALDALFTDDVRLNSPVKSKPFEGKPAVLALFRVLLRTFEGFHYVGHFDGSVQSAGVPFGAEGTEGPATVLPFRTTVGERQVHGIDMLHLTPEGLIDEITVMLRPQTAVVAVGEAVLAGLLTDGVVTG